MIAELVANVLVDALWRGVSRVVRGRPRPRTARPRQVVVSTGAMLDRLAVYEAWAAEHGLAPTTQRGAGGVVGVRGIDNVASEGGGSHDERALLLADAGSPPLGDDDCRHGDRYQVSHRRCIDQTHGVTAAVIMLGRRPRAGLRPGMRRGRDWRRDEEAGDENARC